MSFISKYFKYLFPKRVPKNFLWQISSKFSSGHLSDFERQQKTPKCMKDVSGPLALYGGRHTVTMIPGLGVGPEILSYVREIFAIMGAPVDFEVVEIDASRKDNEEFDYALISIKRNGVAIMGNIEPRSTGPQTLLRNVTLRKVLDLYVYVLWCKSYPEVPAKQKSVDVVLMRQNTEGEYSTLEHDLGLRDNKVVESLKIITAEDSIKLATYAFEFARKYKRRKVTIIHKANIMKLSDGLFLKVCQEVARQYSDIAHDEMIIDNCCMQIVLHPEKFDIILAPNLYGSILGNIICGMNGGGGLFSGTNYGDHYALFETGVRVSGSSMVGKNIANPVALLNASVDMLQHLGHVKYAKQLEGAIYKTLCIKKIHTPDLGGTATTVDVINGIIDNL